MHLVFLFLLLCSSIFAEQESSPCKSFAEMLGSHDTIVGGKVNVVTGTLVLDRLDLELSGIADLPVVQSHGENNFSTALEHIDLDKKRLSFNLDCCLGCDLDFHIRGLIHREESKLNDELLRVRYELNGNYRKCKGLTNGFQEFPNGQSNLKNIKLAVEYDNKISSGKSIRGYPYFLTLGNGETRIYEHDYFDALHHHLPIEIRMPNGHRIFFYFDHAASLSNAHYGRPTHIRVTNDDATEELGHYKLTYQRQDLKGMKWIHTNHIESNDGRVAKHTIHSLQVVKKTIVDRANDIPTTYVYEGNPHSNNPVVSIQHPDNRKLEASYYKEPLSEDDYPMIGRIKEIQEPVGPNNSMRPTYSFAYNCLGCFVSSTMVKDALGRETRYRYNQYGVLEKKEIFKEKAYKTDPELCYEYTWAKDEKDFGNLLCKSLKDAKGNCLASTKYEYDERGNVLTHTITGNFTGKGDEAFAKTYTYSDDGFNLMLSESDGKSITRMEYQPNTNLLTKKWIEVEGKTIQREFHTYDKNATCIETIVDDGSGDQANDLNDVTERHITRITPKKTLPGIGLPEIVEEFYLEDGIEKLLKKSASTFSKEGWKQTEEVYDAEENLAYSLYWKYNSYGQPVEWNDPLGHVYRKLYDANGNCLEEWGPREDCYTSYTYDLANRCTSKNFHTAEGSVLTETYTYDLCSNRTSIKDHTGAVTKFEYDHRNRLCKTINPLGEVTEQTYDLLDHISSSKDEKGNITYIKHTAYGKPYRIDYPDGSFEEMTYSLDGLLLERLNKNGSVTRKSYDALNREVLEELYFNGELITCSAKAYNAFHLVSETDGEGNITHYSYDGAGRKIEERRGFSITQYSYDTLGRVEQERQWDGAEWVVKSFTYDLLDRVLTEAVEGYSLKSFAYNETGQVIEETALGTTYFDYDSQDRLIKKTDALGFSDYHIYDDFQRIHCHIDSLGLQTITYFNAVKCPIKIEKRKECILSTTFNTYDNRSNLIAQQITLTDRSIINRWEYDALKRPIKEIKGAGTQEETVTLTSYTPGGEKASVVKPDGVVIYYTYTPAGDLKTLTSSDGSVSYIVSYNRRGQVIEAKDLLTGLSTLRNYDKEGNLSSEHLANGLSLSFTYDPLHRTRSLQLPNTSFHWRYKGPYLSSVSKENTTIYCTRYDQAGHLLEMRSPAGTLTYERDLLGRATRVHTPLGPLCLSYDPMGNLIHKEWKSESFDYTYDSLYQLLSETGHVYQYDNLYNRTNKDGETSSYNALNQSTSLAYDSNGNLLSLNGISFRYDALDRLIQAGDTIYTYDFFNRRLSKNEDRYLYHGQNEIGSPDKEELRLLANGRGAEIGASVLLELKNKLYFPLHDEQGSLIALLSSTGSPTEEMRYTAFGEEAPSTPLSPWRFSSKRFDPESSLIYFGRRYYSPFLGRWTTSDPAGYSDGPNLYAYVHNNPLTHFDLYGLFDFFNRDSHDHADHSTKEQKSFEFKDIEEGFNKITKNFRDNDRAILNTAKDFIKDNPRLSRALGLGDHSDHLSLGAMPSTRNVTLVAATAIKSAHTLAKSAAKNIRSTPMLKTNQVEKTVQAGKSLQPVNEVKKIIRKVRLEPHKSASGAHSTFRRDLGSQKITHYETYQPQTNPRNPNPWERVKRFDGPVESGDKHYNKIMKEYIETPHIHDPRVPGGVRYPEPWETPS